jgi:uncharacterized membrane protein (UPF0127 family)
MICMLLAAALLCGCNSKQPAPEGFQTVELDGTDFTLELVADDSTRFTGLGGRKELEEHGGMLFSFPYSRKRSFLMRDCYIDIDLLFLDASGRIVAKHHMPFEEPRREDEGTTEYDARLIKYSSKFNAQYAIEIRGGLLETMDYEPGDKIKLDLEYLKSVSK